MKILWSNNPDVRELEQLTYLHMTPEQKLEFEKKFRRPKPPPEYDRPEPMVLPPTPLGRLVDEGGNGPLWALLIGTVILLGFLMLVLFRH